jgi:hypothetical protein
MFVERLSKFFRVEKTEHGFSYTWDTKENATKFKDDEEVRFHLHKSGFSGQSNVVVIK